MNKLISDLYIEGLEISVPDLKKVSISKYSELRYDPRIRKVINQILNNNLNTLNWAKVADSVGLSRAHFFRLFSNSTGVSPTTFTNTLKMEQGLMLLSDLNLPIQNIAEAVGFVPMNNFTRFFSAHQGVTPSKYRKVMDIVK
ncbi:helix-turn-helix domain-containing protein [Acinetobacter sichuanensis]|uniref:AraC family transcriptional regulator n=1 Tax=Acinetobacter sichuanensis TaxID=2136183 RepID=A0A371YNF3_9GAMM|nr:AraC family transcriptional regulator [Acinetobacter sichuanensis]RFC82995.1 AraC family transcriptional regulator [Acinetobacter sichuanensis]